eukprot:CAMPEP_0170379894 /NCGR_PEP_ID=MMETSP0117_2-20130122/13579_1 /TAXON_ID=400756 /ORGANISM="Durinskia baltica, Strain CSIRO CS-38" /LENGTH=75 /DNA_ID=CAMNT_0010635349 /DNA_START=126 /DNA_END=353 /DNA_ORIENTATION=-
MKDLRVAKIDRKVIARPCTQEFDAYLLAMGAFETDDDVEVDRTLANALSDCMEGLKSQHKPVSLKFHLKRFVKYK